MGTTLGPSGFMLADEGLMLQLTQKELLMAASRFKLRIVAKLCRVVNDEATVIEPISIMV